MKKLILLFVACVSLTTITSCSKDDDSSSASLEGKWEWSKEGFSANGQEVLSNYEHTAGCSKDYIVITSTTVSDHTFESNGTGGCSEDIFNTTYTRSGNTLTVGTGALASTAQIASLTGSTLKITYADEDTPGLILIDVYTRVN